MGLAAPKNRIRISNDPQNTTWANNTSRFGHRVLTSHGWTPGASLGAVDAAHSSHYTAASHSHIRVLLKDDTLGLGAKRGSERPENFGLAGLANVLGRLNGKEVEVKKEEERRVEVERKGYVARRYGFMNFVSGGFLVGDKIEKKSRKEVEAEFNKGIKKEEESDAEETKDKSKKRKRSKDDDDESEKIKEEENEDDEPKLKRKKKSMNLREAAAAEDEAASKSKKDKKDKKKSKKSSSASEQDTAAASSASEEPLSDKAKRKAEKRARKEEKKLKKALKKAAKQAARANKEDASDSSSDDDAEETSAAATPITSSAPTTGTSTPVGLTFAAGGRHAARAKYIRQKKMAGMDPQALREIFMIKTPS